MVSVAEGASVLVGVCLEWVLLWVSTEQGRASKGKEQVSAWGSMEKEVLRVGLGAPGEGAGLGVGSVGKEQVSA